jgi:hypothetical protein
VIASVGFVRRAEETGDELLAWFALRVAVRGAAAVNYFLFPSLYPGWVYTADIFRLRLLPDARGWCRPRDRGVAAAARGGRGVGERRGSRATSTTGWRRSSRSSLARQRSLVEDRASTARSRTSPRQRSERSTSRAPAIAALSRSVDDPLDVALAQAAEDVAARTGAHIRFDLAPDVRVSPDLREDLARIVRGSGI